jgi:hypothetical protein
MHLKQKILLAEIHEPLQRDAGAPEEIRTPDPQIPVSTALFCKIEDFVAV